MIWLFLLLLVGFLGVILYRAYQFNPKPQPDGDGGEVEFDRDAAVYALQTLVQFKTVSNVDHSLEDDGEFSKLFPRRRHSDHPWFRS